MIPDVKPTDPTPYQAAVMRAEREAYIPPHVRRAYRWTPLRDVFVDARGRCWHAGTDALREALPWNPESYERIPEQFWSPRGRGRKERQEEKEALDRIHDQLAEIEPPAYVGAGVEEVWWS